MICNIIYPIEAKNNHAYPLLQERAAIFGIDLRLKYFSAPPSTIVDMALIRGYNFEYTKELEMSGIRVINSTMSMQNALNKAKTYEILKALNIPQPNTFVVGRDINYFDVVDMVQSKEFVVKSLFGSKGNQVWLVKEMAEYDRVVKILTTEREETPFLIQQYINESSGKDIRVWVAGDKASASIMRENKSDFKSNITYGATPKLYKLNSELSKLAVESSRGLGLEISAVDFLISSSGYKVCEVNGNAGFRSALMCGEISVIDDIFKYIKKE